MATAAWVCVTVSPHGFSQRIGRPRAATSVMACKCRSVGTTIKTTMIGDKVTIKGLYIKASQASGGAEIFYVDSIMNNGAGTLPALAPFNSI